MKRRSYLTAMLAGIAALNGIRAEPGSKNPIVENTLSTKDYSTLLIESM